MGIKSLFATAPRIKVRVDNQVLAYGIGLNVNISVDVQPIYVLGQYHPVALEPTMYNVVTGTMQIMRLTTQTTQANRNSNSVGFGAEIGKSAAAFSGGVQGVVYGSGNAEKTNEPTSRQKLYQHIDPRTILSSESFNIDLYMKLIDPASPENKPKFIEKIWLSIKDCRITSRNSNISMGQLINTPLNFQGLIATPVVDGNDAFLLDQADGNE
jgi:hypothetical protein